MTLLQIQRLARNFNGVLAVDDVSFTVAEGETVGVIGPNGAGKTTLFNLITGLDQPTSGDIRFAGESLVGVPADRFAARGIARTFQHGRVFGNLSVLENVLIGAHARRQIDQRLPLVGLVQEVWHALIRPGATNAEEARLRSEAEAIIARFGDRLTPRIHQPAFRLSYANRRRVEMARALALHPRLLLLDEPTAGMNPTETAEVLAFIRSLKAQGLTILLIEHKLSLVMALSDRVIVMDNGQQIAAGRPELIRTDPRVIEAYLGHQRPPAAAAHSDEAPVATPVYSLAIEQSVVS